MSDQFIDAALWVINSVQGGVNATHLVSDSEPNVICNMGDDVQQDDVQRTFRDAMNDPANRRTLGGPGDTALGRELAAKAESRAPTLPATCPTIVYKDAWKQCIDESRLPSKRCYSSSTARFHACSGVCLHQLLAALLIVSRYHSSC